MALGVPMLKHFRVYHAKSCRSLEILIADLISESGDSTDTLGLPYKFYVLGQIGLSKQCRPRSDCF